MGATKYDFYDDALIKTAELLKALAHPARLKAFLMIANETQKDVTSEDINQEIGLSRSTLSVHMKKLSDSGFLKSAVTTTTVHTTCVSYRLNRPALSHIVNLLNHSMTKLKKKNSEKSEEVKRFYSAFKSTSGWHNFYVT